MCALCPDYVDKCYDCDLAFYLGDNFCNHLQVKYGHVRAGSDDQYLDIED